MTKPQIVINVHGGLVQDVFVSDPQTHVTLVDWDTATCNLADEGVVEVATHSGQRQWAYVAEYATNDWRALDGTDVALALAEAEPTLTLNCEGCSDNSGVRKDVDCGCRISLPAGYTVIERCDSCDKYPDDFEAAKTVAADPQWAKCDSGHEHAIGKLPESEEDNPALYDVHLFPVARVKVAGIAAGSHREAVEKACAEAASGLNDRFVACGAEFADEFSHFVVDVAGDEEFRQSLSFYSQSEPLISNLGRLVLWYDQADRDHAELDRIIADARDVIATSI